MGFVPVFFYYKKNCLKFSHFCKGEGGSVVPPLRRSYNKFRKNIKLLYKSIKICKVGLAD